MTDAPAKVTLTRDLDEIHDSRRRHARRAAQGAETRVGSGAYVDTPVWESLGRREQYLLRIRAVADTRLHRPVISHWSAAAIHALPSLDPWPSTVHFTVGLTSGGRSSGPATRHSMKLTDDDVVEVDGVLVTSVARTLVDLAAGATLLSSVVALDHALHVDRRGGAPPRVTVDELWSRYAALMPFRAHARARDAIELATTKADSPLESVSRVNMRAIGCPRPVLQQRFEDHRGLIGFSEFYWHELALVGEADGRSKYTDPRYRGGRTLEEVLLDEKERADRIRALGPDVSRWGWSTAIHAEALRRHLSAAGLPMGRPWTTAA
jgi:hypothetical protein